MRIQLGQPLRTHQGYPYTGIKDTGCIVLFYEPGCGVCLRSDNNYEAGEHRTDWCEATQFRRTRNQVILENE